MHGSTGGRPVRHRLAAVPALVAAAVLLGGCAGTDSAAPENKPAKTSEQPATTSDKPAPRYTVEQLAAELGCTAKFRGPTKDFRQASCTKDGEPIVLLDFETPEGQSLWLENAIGFGGIYLVGDGWALSGVSEEYMESLSKTLGGTVEDKKSYGS